MAASSDNACNTRSVDAPPSYMDRPHATLWHHDNNMTEWVAILLYEDIQNVIMIKYAMQMVDKR